MHGLFRSTNLELGRDEDTGGQITYVLEMAKAMGELKEVEKVEIVTRRIIDPEYPGYSKVKETVAPKVDIIRIECGPKKYIKKVHLWPYLDEYIANNKAYYRKIKRKPDILHSHYADAGLVCSRLAHELKIPLVHTGHSLGIPKMQRLGVNKRNFEKYNELYCFSSRLAAENTVIAQAGAIVASTNEEINQQYAEYDLKGHRDKFVNIPPGIDIRRFHPPAKKLLDKDKGAQRLFNNVVQQGLKYPQRRIIGVLSRLDKRKNLVGLVKAYAEDTRLHATANLVIFAPTLFGNKETQSIINELNRLMRAYNLYDNIALPGIHLDYEFLVPAFYRFLAEKRGIFVNPALIEPFGLTLLEAQATGVPVIATKNGGPSDFIVPGENGLLIDPTDTKDISRKINTIFNHDEVYDKIARQSVQIIRKNYTWGATARSCVKVYKRLLR